MGADAFEDVAQVVSGSATIRGLSDFALHCGVTQGLYWTAAIFREADFPGRIPKTQRNCLSGSNLQWGERVILLFRPSAAG